nr:MAG TPA: hypothetical protein [Caudoviricetes sp.]
MGFHPKLSFAHMRLHTVVPIVLEAIFSIISLLFFQNYNFYHFRCK